MPVLKKQAFSSWFPYLEGTFSIQRTDSGTVRAFFTAALATSEGKVSFCWLIMMERIVSKTLCL